MVVNLIILIQGASASQLEKDIGQEFPPNEHFFGLVNVRINLPCNFIYILLMFTYLSIVLTIVWQHMLLQLSVTSSFFLPAISRKGPSIQAIIEKKRNFANVSDGLI